MYISIYLYFSHSPSQSETLVRLFDIHNIDPVYIRSPQPRKLLPGKGKKILSYFYKVVYFNKVTRNRQN